MGYRETPLGKRQGKVLSDLEKASGRTRKAIVADVSFGHDQYKRYLRGDTPMKWDQIPQFARAFRIPIADLTRRLGLLDDEVAEIDGAFDALLNDAVEQNRSNTAKGADLRDKHTGG